MILKFLCEPFILLSEFLVGLFPAFPRFTWLTDAIQPFAHVLKFANLFVSLSVVSKGLIVLLVVYNIKFGWSILMWIIRKIPGVS